MTVVGVSMIRDEADVIGPVLRHMARQVDAIVIANNRSTDETRKIIDEVSDSCAIPILVGDDDEIGYKQSVKMSTLAAVAHDAFGAEWIVPFDADEIWYSPAPRIADFLARIPTEHDIVKAFLWDHVCTGIDDPAEVDPVQRMRWRRADPAPLPKVACRYRDGLTIEMGNHGASYQDLGGATSDRRIAVRHFPYRSPEQLVRKVRNGAEAYAATDLPEHYGAHWRQWGRMLHEHGEETIHDLFHTWYYREHPDEPVTIEGEIQSPLRCDPAPARP